MKTLRKIIICILVMIFIVTLPIFGSEDSIHGITREQIQQLSDTQKSVLEITLDAAISTMESSSYDGGSIYSSILNTNLSDFTVDELEQIKDLLSEVNAEPAQNESQTNNAEPTNRRVVTEYCELYMYRADRLKLSGFDYNLQPVSLPFVNQAYDGTTSISVSAGTVYVNPADMTIERASLIILDLNKPTEENDSCFAATAIALSALEYTSFDDSMFGLTKKNGSNSATEEGFRILNEYFTAFVDSGNLVKVLDGEKVLIYSGNYDYYVRYHDSDVVDATYFIIQAEARD